MADSLKAISGQVKAFDYVRNIKLTISEALGESFVGVLYAVITLFFLLLV